MNAYESRGNNANPSHRCHQCRTCQRPFGNRPHQRPGLLSSSCFGGGWGERRMVSSEAIVESIPKPPNILDVNENDRHLSKAQKIGKLTWSKAGVSFWRSAIRQIHHEKGIIQQSFEKKKQKTPKVPKPLDTQETLSKKKKTKKRLGFAFQKPRKIKKNPLRRPLSKENSPEKQANRRKSDQKPRRSIMDHGKCQATYQETIPKGRALQPPMTSLPPSPVSLPSAGCDGRPRRKHTLRVVRDCWGLHSYDLQKPGSCRSSEKDPFNKAYYWLLGQNQVPWTQTWANQRKVSFPHLQFKVALAPVLVGSQLFCEAVGRVPNEEVSHILHGQLTATRCLNRLA